MRRVVSVFLPTWPTDRLRRAISGRTTSVRTTSGRTGCAAPPADAPLILAAPRSGRRVITAADAAARALGLHPGLPVGQAQARVGGLTILPADPEADAAALAGLAAWALWATPLTAPAPPDGVWLDITGCAHLHGGEAALLATLHARLARAGIAARLGLADTPGAAHALARAHSAPPIAAPGEHQAALAPLSVAALRLDPETVALLGRLGVATIGDLMRLPRAPLARRAGRTPLLRLDQALGRAEEPIAPLLPPEAPRARKDFAEPIATAEQIAAAISALVGPVCATLEAEGLGARGLDLVFARVDGAAQTVRIGTAAPSRAPAHLARLLIERIETVDPGLGVEAMTLVATSTDRLAYAQPGGLLADAATPPMLPPLVDRLVNRLGPTKVWRAAPVETDIPERAVRRLPPLAPPTGSGSIWDRPRPIRLLDPPQEVEAMALLPDHPPAQFVWRRVRHRIRRADGPERIAGEWWLRDAEMDAVRDYYRLEDESGRRFWVFRRGNGTDPHTGDRRWFLHGLA
jgi:protein ImuB